MHTFLLRSSVRIAYYFHFLSFPSYQPSLLLIKMLRNNRKFDMYFDNNFLWNLESNSRKMRENVAKIQAKK